MFHVNDVILYSSHGVCEITAIEEKVINGVTKTYYVLRPVNDHGATIFAPTDNEIVLKKMRKLLSEAEIHALIDSMPNEKPVWIANEAERRECYKNILARGDHLELIKMIKAIYLHKKELEANKKRLHVSDERFFKDAEQLLYNEFQYVLKLKSKNELLGYILSRIETPC